MSLVNIDPLSVLIGFVVGVTPAIVAEMIQYRHQKRLSMVERLAPRLERMLGSIARLIKYGKDAKGLESSCRQLESATKNKNEELVTLVMATFVDFCYGSLLSMVDVSKEFETVYLELEKDGMLETMKAYDERLVNKLEWLHGCTQTFSEEKIVSTKDAIAVTHTLVHNTVHFAEDCEKPLRKFVSG